MQDPKNAVGKTKGGGGQFVAGDNVQSLTQPQESLGFSNLRDCGVGGVLCTSACAHGLEHVCARGGCVCVCACSSVTVWV